MRNYQIWIDMYSKTAFPIRILSDVYSKTPFSMHDKLIMYSKTPFSIHDKAIMYSKTPFPIHDKAICSTGSGLCRVNRVLAEYGSRPVSIDEAVFATRMDVYRQTADAANREANEDNREDNSDSSATIPDLMEVCHGSRATIKRTLKALKVAHRIRRTGGTRGYLEVLA